MEYERTLLPLAADGALKRDWVENSMRLARLAGATSLPPVNDIFTERFAPLKRVTSAQ
jgi:NitT/TauT family transport system substrate-binding protein